ncbi:YfhD family protein [Priestia aryabhattai]|uniref:YfhD family protein n=1 Tax=Priestia aryabhattai TaxID=412384 RepID=UPI002E21D1EE|nr:YfhD family protein [Priestia aryabhattai]
MGRANNHKSSHNNKGLLPQTPKELKIAPDQANEEFSRELTQHHDAKAKQDLILKQQKEK